MNKPDLAKAIILNDNCQEHGSNLYALEEGGIYCINGHMVGKGYGKGMAFDAADYYSVGDDCETLEHKSLEECLYQHVDDCWDPDKSKEENLDEAFPVDVCGWRRKEKPKTFGGIAVECMMERLEEDWAEEYGDFDGDYPPWEKEKRAQVMADVQAVLDKHLVDAHVWQCEVSCRYGFDKADALPYLKGYLEDA